MNKIGDKLNKIIGRTDQFVETASFQIDGRSGYPSLSGSLISLAIFGTVIAYGTNKYDKMINYEDTTYD